MLKHIIKKKEKEVVKKEKEENTKYLKNAY